MKHGQSQKTICNGEVKYLINRQEMMASAKFTGVKRNNLCATCPFDEFCTVLFDTEAAAEITPETPAPMQVTEPVIIQKFITVTAFTGMPIGNLLIIKEAKLFIDVQTKKGQVIRFDRRTGVQINCENHKYANRVDIDAIPAYIPFYKPFAKEE